MPSLHVWRLFLRIKSENSSTIHLQKTVYSVCALQHLAWITFVHKNLPLHRGKWFGMLLLSKITFLSLKSSISLFNTFRYVLWRRYFKVFRKKATLCVVSVSKIKSDVLAPWLKLLVWINSLQKTHTLLILYSAGHHNQASNKTLTFLAYQPYEEAFLLDAMELA